MWPPMYQPELETAEREKIEALQLHKLRHMIDYCYQNVPFYKKKLKQAGITSSGEIRTLNDIRHIPFTTKDDLHANYPDGFLAVPMSKVARIQASSGTVGKPTIGYYTKKDLETWSMAAARVLVLNGIKEDDIFQLSIGYGLFTGGLGFHQGAERIGCTIVPASTGNTEKQLVLLKDLGVTAITATPSYAAYLSERIYQSGEINGFHLKKILLGAERCSENMRKTIERNLNVLAMDNYGLTEFFGPGVAGECNCRNGLHITEDVFFPEIVDLDTGEILSDKMQGELVLTSLEREAMPLLRYRTRDLTSLDHSACQCGRTTVRMQAPYGRTDDMFVFKGVNVFPTQVEYAMAGIEGLGPHYQITLSRDACFRDSALLEVELSSESISKENEMHILSELNQHLRETVIIRMDISLKKPGLLERFSGKSRRVNDKRYEAE